MKFKQVKLIYRALFPRKHYWFHIELKYKVDGRLIFTIPKKVGFIKKKDILNDRGVKKCFAPLHTNKAFREFLKNGILTMEPICYLGRF